MEKKLSLQELSPGIPTREKLCRIPKWDSKRMTSFDVYCYERGEDGLPQIVEAEAEIVRLIFSLFMEGKTQSYIANYLMRLGIPSPGGKKTWQVSTVRSILWDEKYCGNALLQKKFTVNFLTKQVKKNEGEVPQFFVKGSHAPIIEPDEFDMVQAELERRNELGRPMEAPVRSLLSSSAVIAAAGTAPKYGVAIPSTGRSSGNATTSTRATTNAGQPM